MKKRKPIVQKKTMLHIRWDDNFSNLHLSTIVTVIGLGEFSLQTLGLLMLNCVLKATARKSQNIYISWRSTSFSRSFWKRFKKISYHRLIICDRFQSCDAIHKTAALCAWSQSQKCFNRWNVWNSMWEEPQQSMFGVRRSGVDV